MCLARASCFGYRGDRAALQPGRNPDRVGSGSWEAYAVLTRLPPPHRLSPEDALALLEADFINPAKIVTLDRKAYVALLRRAPHDGILGGRTYDAVIVACALKGKVATILTFNEQHFLPFAEWGMAIVVPGKGR